MYKTPKLDLRSMYRQRVKGSASLSQKPRDKETRLPSLFYLPRKKKP